MNIGNHHFLSMSNEIDNICHPLKMMGIHLFSYRRTYQDGARINLSNDPYWLSDYYNLSLYKTSLFEHDIRCYVSGFSVWPQESSREVFIHGRKHYNSDHGITYTVRHQNHCEFFIFGAHKENKNIVNFYINNLELLKDFCEYFLIQAKSILKIAEKNLIKIKLLHRDSIDLSSIHSERKPLFNEISKKIFQMKMTWSQQYKLSHREIDCLYGILDGKTAKEIAINLNLSHRTVEEYLNNLKNKTNCKNKFDLLKKFLV